MPVIPAEWLQSPDSSGALSYTPDGAYLVDVGMDIRYPVSDRLAILLPQQQGALRTSSALHDRLQSEFTYAEHYEADAEAFDYFAGWEDAASTHENRRLREMIMSRIPSTAERILDVGCGSAWIAAHYGQMGKAVVSMDISRRNPRQALENYPFDRHYGLVADALHLPFREGVFDVIVASEIIEHVADPSAFLRSILPALTPGGLLIVTTPFNEKLAYSLCVHCNRPTPHHAHLHSFTEESLRACLPKELRHAARTSTFMNKALLRLRTHVILRHFPFWLWRIKDAAANAVIRKPARLMIVVQRPTK